MRLLRISRISEKFTLPARLKGTVVEKWVNYWKTLARDYRDVTWDVIKEAKQKPRKALLISSVAYVAYKLAETNPNKEAFMQLLRFWNNQKIMVSPALQNPISNEYLRQLEMAINQNRLRFQSFGLFTLLWLDRYDANDCTYPAVCEYTRVRFWDIPKHVVDIGICGNYWHLQWKMHNFDINY